MKIHEYQAKGLLAGYGVPIPEGKVAHSVEDAVSVAEGLARWPLVVKAQVYTGGRGKAGGVKVARNMAELKEHTAKILGLDINGSVTQKVLVETAVDIKTEIYLGIILDRATKRPVLMACAEGGINIEELAVERPEAILKLGIPPAYGLRAHHVRELVSFLGVPDSARRTFERITVGLVQAFYAKDGSLAEINPLVITGAGEAIACDAKFNFDDNALFKHPDIEAMRDDGEEEPLEVEARKRHLNYVKLDGRIGCIVNGAGLAMGTMDIVKHYGGEPANFLDIGGGAKAQQVAEALQLITTDPAVNTIFFNIFGGIVRCDLVAEGILTALENLPGFDYPIVIRLSGTNDEKAKQMLEGTKLHLAPTMAEGAQLAVKISQSR